MAEITPFTPVLRPGQSSHEVTGQVPAHSPTSTLSDGCDTLVLCDPRDGLAAEFTEFYTLPATATPTVHFSVGEGAVHILLNGTWQLLPASIPAATPFRLAVLRLNNLAFYATITLTYA
ncbi:hypothetical protein [Hymenobacter sp. AT01-02]|uniref:hypothetical protein n=1 Tax=Hymenobacter sp. AT01-02 TaxID=1571877 RepID=UPI0005F1AB51|nr:hypothetical protein [Hymenobacter sp. AT01-02]